MSTETTQVGKPRPSKAERSLRQHLKGLVAAVEAHVRALDVEMKGPSDHERGKRVARLTNALEVQIEQAKYFGLGIDFRTGKPRKAAKREARRVVACSLCQKEIVYQSRGIHAHAHLRRGDGYPTFFEGTHQGSVLEAT